MNMPGADSAQAVEALRRGDVVAYPTEALYALGVDIRQADAVQKLRTLKGREAHKPLAVLIADPSQLHALVVDVSPAAQALMKAFWPGPLTLIFNAAPGLPEGITANTGTVAIRCSSHPVATSLCRALGGPITATGCNRGGSLAVRAASDVDPTLRAQLAAVLEGAPAPAGRQCTVVDARLGEPTIIRESLIARVDIDRVLGPPTDPAQLAYC